MPRPGYTNLAPSAERARLFQIVADRLGMDPEEHRVRVIIVDQALAALALGLTEEAISATGDTVRAMIRDGLVEARKNESGRWRIPVGEVDRFR